MLTVAWRDAAAQSIVDRTAVARFQAKQNKRVLASSLNLWTTRVVEIKARELDIAEQRDVNILKGAFKRWRAARKRQTDLEALAESVIDIKRERESPPVTKLIAETLRRSMTRWSFRTHRAQDLRHRADFLQAEQDQRILIETFGVWYDKRRERELRPAEEETQLRHEDALMFSVFDKWTAKSRYLIAVQFDQRRVRAAVLPRWQRALERHRELKRVEAEHDRRLMVDALTVWKSAYRAKVAKKPYRARRRLQGSSYDESQYGRRSPLDDPPRRYSPSPGLPEVERVRERNKPKARPSLPNLGRTPARRSFARDTSPSRGPASVSSEPAYSRLRREMRAPGSGRDPGAGAGSEGRVASGSSRLTSGSSRTSGEGREGPRTSELVRALRDRVQPE
jgi:protein SFI1